MFLGKRVHLIWFRQGVPERGEEPCTSSVRHRSDQTGSGQGPEDQRKQESHKGEEPQRP